jgi:hypothetical protein
MFEIAMKIFSKRLSFGCTCFVLGTFVFTTSTLGQSTTGSAAKNPDDVQTQEKQTQPIEIEVAKGNLKFTVTGDWKKVPPKSRMLEAEIKVPKVDGDEQDGRLTIMGAGGSIDANIVRWQGQFSQPDGSETADKTKVEEKKIADQKVHLVDITGTFMDAPGGPFSGQPKVERKNYRMLAAIIETATNGNYFVKFYGPKKTIDKNAKAFKQMIESMKAAD